jgi:hypothetical protein
MPARKPLGSARHIVVEGPIGVGKTSLARRLGAHLEAQLLLEQPELNPFLSRFYQDQRRYALQTQLFSCFSGSISWAICRSLIFSPGRWLPTICSRRTLCSLY